MEYCRKLRWANYTSPKCKEYLRNDFSYECAYCKLQEQEVGVVGVDFFEIDHFRPQSLDFPDMHKYSNLYYCCEKCNSEKSDTWSTELLDPCEDDIFSGDNPPIIGGKSGENYKYIAQNNRGTFYIDTFKLNSRTQVRIREARENHKSSLQQINELIGDILLKLGDKADLQDLKIMIGRLDVFGSIKQQELPRGEMFEKAEAYLDDRDIENSLVFEEYNMDIKVKISNITYCCELIVDDSTEDKIEYRKKIRVEKLRTWVEKIGSNFGILFYYPKLDRMYFYPVSDRIDVKEIADGSTYKQIKIGQECLLG